MSRGLQHQLNQIRDLAASRKANPQALFTHRKDVQVARDCIRCATTVVTGQNDNSQDCHSMPAIAPQNFRSPAFTSSPASNSDAMSTKE